MKNNDTPQRDAEYVLEQIDNDYQLRHRGRDDAIYINDTAALIWELCDGKRKIAEIKRMLKEAYPDAAAGIDADVDEVISMLAHHGALTAARSKRSSSARR